MLREDLLLSAAVLTVILGGLLRVRLSAVAELNGVDALCDETSVVGCELDDVLERCELLLRAESERSRL